jgi:hypothetical protein
MQKLLHPKESLIFFWTSANSSGTVINDKDLDKALLPIKSRIAIVDRQAFLITYSFPDMAKGGELEKPK